MMPGAPRFAAPPAFLEAPGVRRILAALNPLATGRGETRVVGGAVRNALMGLPVTEVDFATVLPPEEVTARASAAGLGVVPTGLAFGTVTVVAAGEGHEVTTLRRDLETDGRRATVVAYGSDWAEDARRRDLTINALYCDGDGTIFDPLGGFDDVIARRVRFIGDPAERIREDFLRILRFFRFHAQFGRGPLDSAGFVATIRERRGMARLSAERVRAELFKLLAAPGAVATVAALAETGILTAILGVTRLGRFERLVAGDAALASPNPAPVRLAALCVAVEEDAERLAAALKVSRKEAAVLAAAGRHVHALAHRAEAPFARRILRAEGAATFRQVVRLASAEAGAAPGEGPWPALLALPETDPVPPFPIRGADLAALGVPPGEGMGRALAAAQALWEAADYRPGRAQVLDEARRAAGLTPRGG